MVRRFVVSLFVLALVAGMCGSAVAQVDLDKARAIVDEYQSAVVTLSLVIEMSSSYSGQTNKRESKTTAVATIIDPSGLAVASLSSIDPTALQERFMQSDDMKMSSKIIDAKIRQPQGTDIPVDVVLRDKDLDLAFVRPKSPVATPFKFVDLSAGVPAKLLDQVVSFSKLGQVAGFGTYASIDKVMAVITKPISYYVVEGSCGVGCPAFSADGKPIGVVVIRSQASSGGDTESMFGPMGGMLTVILPCERIATGAAKAKTAKPATP